MKKALPAPLCENFIFSNSGLFTTFRVSTNPRNVILSEAKDLETPM